MVEETRACEHLQVREVLVVARLVDMTVGICKVNCTIESKVVLAANCRTAGCMENLCRSVDILDSLWPDKNLLGQPHVILSKRQFLGYPIIPHLEQAVCLN